MRVCCLFFFFRVVSCFTVSFTSIVEETFVLLPIFMQYMIASPDVTSLSVWNASIFINSFLGVMVAILFIVLVLNSGSIGCR